VAGRTYKRETTLTEQKNINTAPQWRIGKRRVNHFMRRKKTRRKRKSHRKRKGKKGRKSGEKGGKNQSNRATCRKSPNCVKGVENITVTSKGRKKRLQRKGSLKGKRG